MQIPITGLSVPPLCLNTYIEVHTRRDEIIQRDAFIVKVGDMDNIAGEDHHVNERVPHDGEQRYGKERFSLILLPLPVGDPQYNTQRTERDTGYRKDNYQRFHGK